MNHLKKAFTLILRIMFNDTAQDRDPAARRITGYFTHADGTRHRVVFRLD